MAPARRWSTIDLIKGKGISLTVVVVALAAAGPAPGATPIGNLFTPGGNCGIDVTQLQSAAPGGEYTVPFSGVITSWSFQSGPSPPTSLRLKFGRAAGPGDIFTIVAEGPVEFPAPSVLNTFAARVPVEGGAVLGYHAGPPANGQCTSGATAPHQVVFTSGDPPPGATVDFDGPFTNTRIDLLAVLEPDADGDGFGDETQDLCPAEGGNSGAACVPPVTTITSGPKKKTRKKVATFEFSASDAGSTFECSLDGKTQFKVCATPFVVKVGKGKHTFEVRATDPGGVAETAPASRTWKVKKKKKKR